MSKMQEKFEEMLREEAEVSGMDAPNFQLSPCVLDDGAVIYVSDMTQACWWTFRMAWEASRESLVIELPDPRQTLAGPSLYAQFKEAVEAAGVQVAIKETP